MRSRRLARPYLDGRRPVEDDMASSLEEYPDWPKYREFGRFDQQTNAPSCNFRYDFEFYRFAVRSNWTEVYAHDADGNRIRGNVEDLAEPVAKGAEVKVAIRGLCADLAADPNNAVDHEVLVHLGACFYYTQQKLFIGSANPVVRVRPSIPLEYSSRGWDFGLADAPDRRLRGPLAVRSVYFEVSA